MTRVESKHGEMAPNAHSYCFNGLVNLRVGLLFSLTVARYGLAKSIVVAVSYLVSRPIRSSSWFTYDYINHM